MWAKKGVKRWVGVEDIRERDSRKERNGNRKTILDR